MESPWQRWYTGEHGPRASQFWRDAVCKSVVESEFDTDSARDFSGTMHSRSRAEVRLVKFSSSAHRIRRSHAQARRQNGEHIMLSLQTRGCAYLSQGGVAATLAPGDFGLLDAGAAFDITFPEDTARRLILLPRHLLGSRAPALKRLAGPTLIPKDAILSPLLAATVDVLTDTRQTLEDRMADTLLHTVVEVLGAHFAQAGAGRQPATELSFDTVRRYADMHLADSALSPAGVAAACRISVRTLHRLFARHADTSFEAYLVQARLSLAHEMLAAGRAGSVGEAAFACGFNNLSHFARRFAERFGEQPGLVLKRARAEHP